VILKRLDHVLQDSDLIHAIIWGWASNNNGRRSPPICLGLDSQAACIHAAYIMANLKDFGTTAYIKCHGMDTAVYIAFDSMVLYNIYHQLTYIRLENRLN
jgi:acyl transferase domain-containing protein